MVWTSCNQLSCSLSVNLLFAFGFVNTCIFIFNLVHRSSWPFKDCLISTKTFQPLRNIYETSWSKSRLVIGMYKINIIFIFASCFEIWQLPVYSRLCTQKNIRGLFINHNIIEVLLDQHVHWNPFLWFKKSLKNCQQYVAWNILMPWKQW